MRGDEQDRSEVLGRSGAGEEGRAGSGGGRETFCEIAPGKKGFGEVGYGELKPCRRRGNGEFSRVRGRFEGL